MSPIKIDIKMNMPPREPRLLGRLNQWRVFAKGKDNLPVLMGQLYKPGPSHRKFSGETIFTPQVTGFYSNGVVITHDNYQIKIALGRPAEHSELQNLWSIIESD